MASACVAVVPLNRRTETQEQGIETGVSYECGGSYAMVEKTMTEQAKFKVKLMSATREMLSRYRAKAGSAEC